MRLFESLIGLSFAYCQPPVYSNISVLLLEKYGQLVPFLSLKVTDTEIHLFGAMVDAGTTKGGKR